MERFEVTGVIKVNGHCLFTWRETVQAEGVRTVEVQPEHCASCVEELQRYPRPFRIIYPARAATK